MGDNFQTPREGRDRATKPSFGEKLGCALGGEYPEGERRRGNTLQREEGRESRLRSIILTETAYLIWCRRCKWAIEDEVDPIKKRSVMAGNEEQVVRKPELQAGLGYTYYL
ncbi:hypothetical protein CC2G_009837 [Coprinopsis cinerea AmutBmut pab1-1]|nr:hypothetical protein CC2G_009837 [Coprinopsis cinerea AmutBmut pab1-1]